MRLRTLAALLITAGITAAPAIAADVGVAGKKLILKTNILKGTSGGQLILKDPAITFGGTGNVSLMSGTLEIEYLSTPNQTSIAMPAPWFSNTGFKARYKNVLAPGGPSLVKAAILKAGRLAKVNSKGIGTLSIASPPPSGIRTILTINNGEFATTTRLCTQWSVVTHKTASSGNKIIAKNGTPTACPPLPTCFDGIQNQDETCIDGGGVCAAGCPPGGGCVVPSDCNTGLNCIAGICKCPNQFYTFNVTSNVGGLFDSAEWPGGTTSQSAVPGCSVTINRPNNNIDLVCSLAAPFSINSFSGYSNCFGTGGEDGDGCQPVSCPPLGIGSCCNTRPSCSTGVNGSGSAQYFVQCLQ